MRCCGYRLLLCVALLALHACADAPPPIAVADGSVTILNQTGEDWKNVTITVNDYFGAGVPLLEAGGRAHAPLGQFTTGLGQRWDGRVPVRKIEVKAQRPDGTPVTLVWEEGRITKNPDS